MKYRKKPVIVEAYQTDGEVNKEVSEVIPEDIDVKQLDNMLKELRKIKKKILEGIQNDK